MQLSCYIRTLNEERMIAEVISAAKKVADEIVVVDSGSTDQTVKIAQDLGAKIVHQSWLGNGPQKRVGEAACSHDWVLDLDADEVISSELADQLNEIKLSNGLKPEDVVSLSLITVPPYGKTWWKASVSVRNKLYNRKTYQMPDHKAWDQLDLPQDCKIMHTDGALFHYSFPNIAYMVGKLNSVSTRRAQTAKLKSYRQLQVRVIAAFPIYFIKHYFLRGLWREGIYGFAVACIASQARWLRDIKMLEIHYRNQGKHNDRYE